MADSVPVAATRDNSIFFNCPFDAAYKPIFEALVFAAFDCGYVPRCALEADDAGETRIEKIIAIIRACRLGVHDISRTQPDAGSGFPRFNMPFELGLFLGAKRFGSIAQRRKSCVILDRERYRYQAFLSDIAGQDIRAHADDPDQAIGQLRSWLAAQPRPGRLPGGGAIAARYRAFRAELPVLLRALKLEPAEMEFGDYTNIVSEWLSRWPRHRDPFE